MTDPNIDALTAELKSATHIADTVHEALWQAERERDAAVAALAQRDTDIVAWLRNEADDWGRHSVVRSALRNAARVVERGEYRRTADVGKGLD